jgi:hypothetical protein
MFDPHSSAAGTAASCTWLCAALLLSSAAVHARPRVTLSAITGVAHVALIDDGGVAAAVERATRGAKRRLERESCAGLVDRFDTPAGSPLREVVADLGTTPAGALSRIIFRDGGTTAACGGAVAAFTGPGSRIVFVCGARFAAIDRGRAELIVIHELLHTLGLGERPPRSSEIDRAVATSCG